MNNWLGFYCNPSPTTQLRVPKNVNEEACFIIIISSSIIGGKLEQRKQDINSLLNQLLTEEIEAQLAKSNSHIKAA